MFSDGYCIRAWRIRCHDSGCLQRFEIKVVIANTDTLDEAHSWQDGEDMSIHFPMDNKQNFCLSRVQSKILFTQRRYNIQIGTSGKHWTHALDKGRRHRVD
jgi:hypothetical protein